MKRAELLSAAFSKGRLRSIPHMYNQAMEGKNAGGGQAGNKMRRSGWPTSNGTQETDYCHLEGSNLVKQGLLTAEYVTEI